MCLQKTFVFVLVCVSIPSSFSSLFFLFFAGSKLFHVTLSLFFPPKQTAKLVLDDAAKIEKIKKRGKRDGRWRSKKTFYRLYINLFSRAAPHSIFLCLFVCNRFERVFVFLEAQRGPFILTFNI